MACALNSVVYRLRGAARFMGLGFCWFLVQKSRAPQLAVLPRKVVGTFKSERKPLGQEAALDGQLQQFRFPEKREVMREKNSARRGLARRALGFAINRAQYRPFKVLLNPRRTVSFT